MNGVGPLPSHTGDVRSCPFAETRGAAPRRAPAVVFGRQPDGAGDLHGMAGANMFIEDPSCQWRRPGSVATSFRPGGRIVMLQGHVAGQAP